MQCAPRGCGRRSAWLRRLVALAILLVAAAMVTTLAAIALQIAWGPEPRWVGLASLGFAGGPTLLAGLRIMPNAVRLGSRRDALPRQSELARAICHEHLVCFASILCLLMLQLGIAARGA